MSVKISDSSNHVAHGSVGKIDGLLIKSLFLQAKRVLKSNIEIFHMFGKSFVVIFSGQNRQICLKKMYIKSMIIKW